ncbi:MAG: hypothetical protein HZA32_03025 [Opitutae bacterium]|nr:hypothetical protein [Opitutae bacterium]
MSAAIITIPIKYLHFHEAKAGYCTIQTMTAVGDSRVSINPQTNTVVITPDKTNTRPLGLVFTIADAGTEGPPVGQSVTYTIMGIFFTGVGNSKAFCQPTGAGTNCVTIVDNVSPAGSWSFTVVLKQVVSQGDIEISSKIGVIDPQIENTQE